MRGTSIAVFLALALQPGQSHAGEPVGPRYGQLPQHYRALFEAGRSFYYHVKYVASDSEHRLVAHDGVAVCKVTQVTAEPDALRSVITCDGIPARESLDWFPSSAVGLIDGVWIARASGLWRDNEQDSFGSRDGAKPQIARHPVPFKVQYEKEEFVAFRSARLVGLNWCALRSELSGDEGGVERCYSNDGISSAHEYEAGGTVYEASIRQVPRGQFLWLGKRRPNN